MSKFPDQKTKWQRKIEKNGTFTREQSIELLKASIIGECKVIAQGMTNTIFDLIEQTKELMELESSPPTAGTKVEPPKGTEVRMDNSNQTGADQQGSGDKSGQGSSTSKPQGGGTSAPTPVKK